MVSGWAGVRNHIAWNVPKASPERRLEEVWCSGRGREGDLEEATKGPSCSMWESRLGQETEGEGYQWRVHCST